MAAAALNLGTVADLAELHHHQSNVAYSRHLQRRLDADVTSKDRIGFAIYWVPQSTDNYNGNRRLRYLPSSSDQ